MTPHSYLQGLLSQHALQQPELNILQRIRGEIEACLQIISLDATADKGDIKARGAIDDKAIRDAILHVFDGGEDAFELRKRKYGF